MAKENFEHVVVLINAANTMELGFADEEGVDAVLGSEIREKQDLNPWEKY